MDPVTGSLLSVGGGLGGALGGALAAKKQNRILGEGIRQQDRAGMDAANVSNDFLASLRGSRPDVAGQQAQFSAALRGAPSVSGLPTASGAFRASAAGANTGLAQYGGDLASLFARLRAPGLQRQREAEGVEAMRGRLLPIQQRAASDQFLTSLRAGQVQENPWLGLLAGGLSNVGNAAIANSVR